ncbi:MAG: hypothetical protein U0132_23920 [Gemmatimonadaceae bacterium]
MLRTIAIVAGIYIAIALIAFAKGNLLPIGILLVPILWVTERIRRPPSSRLRRALRRLEADFAKRSPIIIEARVEPWTDGQLRVSLVCGTDAERPALALQLVDLQAQIANAAIEEGIVPELGRGV